MPLALAIKQNAQSLAAAQNTYKLNVIEVNNFVTSVLSSKLPPLTEDPPDFQDYVTALESAKGGALDWVNEIVARLLNVPGEVRTYNTSIEAVLTDALTQADALIKNPKDAAALALLKSDLQGLQTTLSTVTSFISGAVAAIDDFGDNKLPLLASNLELIATKSAADAKADQKQIDDLNDQIDTLRADIKSLTAAIVALAIADGIALTLGVVASIAAFPEGLLVWFVLGPAIAVATTYIALDAEKIKADKAKIQSLLGQIKGITADVATLQVLSKNYSHMAESSETVEASLKVVLQAWQSLESDIGAAVTDIKAAIANGNKRIFSKVKTELASAKHEWEQTYAQAGDLHLDLNVNNAALQYGMSKAQVQAAVAKAKTVDVITYYNAVGS